MLILSGCDYLGSIRGIGLCTSERLFRDNDYDVDSVFNAIKTKMKTTKTKDLKYSIPENYIENYWKAYWTFKLQRVYNPKLKKVVTLHKFPLKKF